MMPRLRPRREEDLRVPRNVRDPSSPSFGDGRGEGSEAVLSPVAIVWPCPLTVDAYAAAGRAVKFPRLDCPSCAGPMGLWSGYWRHVRAAGRCPKIFVPRERCGCCRVSHALLPAFALAWRLDAAEAIGTVITAVAGGGAGSGRRRSGPGCRTRPRADGAAGSPPAPRNWGWRSPRWRSSWAERPARLAALAGSR